MQSNAWCLSKRINVEEMLMVIIIEEKYKSKVDVNNEKNQATSPYVRIQSWRCNLSLSFSAVVLCTVQILSRPKRGRQFQFLINEEESKKGAGRHVAHMYIQNVNRQSEVRLMSKWKCRSLIGVAN